VNRNQFPFIEETNDREQDARGVASCDINLGEASFSRTLLHDGATFQEFDHVLRELLCCRRGRCEMEFWTLWLLIGLVNACEIANLTRTCFLVKTLRVSRLGDLE
jgi:hypothetical protein